VLAEAPSPRSADRQLRHCSPSSPLFLPPALAVDLLRQRLLATCGAVAGDGTAAPATGNGGVLREALVLAHDCALLGHSDRCGGRDERGAARAVRPAAGTTPSLHLDTSASVSALATVATRESTTFTAVGAFHSPSDQVLLLDVFRPNPVAARAAGPVWVPLQSLVEAMRCPPGDAHYCHGYVRLRRRASSPVLLFHQLLLGDAAVELAGGDAASTSGLQRHGQGDCHGGACAANASTGLFAFCDDERHAAQGSGPPAAPCFQRRRFGMAAHWSRSWRGGVERLAEGWSVEALVSRPDAVEAVVASFLSALPGWQQAQTRRAAAAALSSPVAKCIDKLSQQHIAETSSLLVRLEATRVYPLVFAALQRQLALRGAHNVIAEAATGEAIASGLTSGGSSALDVGGSGGGMDGFLAVGGRGIDSGDPCGPSVVSLLASLESNNCAGCGVSCVRINIAHVITVRASAWTCVCWVSWGATRRHVCPLRSCTRWAR